MDNASKALILAGGILISVMIISVAMYVLTNARGFSSSADSQARIYAVQAFNRYYQSFINDNGNIYGIDVLNVYNRSIDDNKGDKEYNITVSVDSAIINALKAPTGAELMNTEFSYNIDGYDSDGYITHITIGN